MAASRFVEVGLFVAADRDADLRAAVESCPDGALLGAGLLGAAFPDDWPDAALLRVPAAVVVRFAVELPDVPGCF